MLTAMEGGEMQIPVTTVDSVVKDAAVSYIKMDIEGSELEALKGCKSIIQRNHPKLAVCIYHKQEDIFEIPSYIMELYDGYTFYIRHYSPFDVETVLYAIPTQRED